MGSVVRSHRCPLCKYEDCFASTFWYHSAQLLTSQPFIQVCVAGYAIIAVALVLLVQATNVYPQLLMGRLLFSLGGSAVSTMVTAVLPVVTGNIRGAPEYQPSMSSDSTLTPDRPTSPNVASHGNQQKAVADSPSSRLAGFVGMCAGCGALVSLAVFLPLPDRFQKSGLSPTQAIKNSYYIVAVVAVLVSVCCLIGLRNLPGEEGKGWKWLLWTFGRHEPEAEHDSQEYPVEGLSRLPYWKQLSTAVALGFQNRDILLGYIGGFVARASSVGISLFIPLFVNHYYRASGLCGKDPKEISGSDMSDIKRSCSDAYILASILTGVSQLVALIAAPAFGFLSDKSRRYHLPLLLASLAGIVGYLVFASLHSPQFKGSDGSPGVFVLMALIGFSQIGAIVCSLAVLSNGILKLGVRENTIPGEASHQEGEQSTGTPANDTNNVDEDPNEQQALLAGPENQNGQHLSQLKGSIAGVYSLYGGAGILLLTKLGGFLFDALSSGSPFYLMAAFNAVLLFAGIVCGLMSKPKLFVAHAAP